MADIHVHIVEGEESVFPEERIAEMLKQGTLTPETYYWREGMAHWRPLSSFRPSNQAVVPERRSGVLPDLAERPVRPERDLPVSSDRTFGTSRRFRFRRKPELLTRIMQAFLVLLLLVTSAELSLAVLSLDAAGGGAASRTQLRPDLGWAGLTVNLVFLIPYCMWIYRATLNCGNFSSSVIFRPKWAVGCHFVPVLNLVRPYQAVQEIWKVSANPRGWQNDSASGLVGLWWGLWLLTLCLAEGSYLVADTARTAADLRNATLVFVGLKAVQLAWYATFFIMVSLVLRNQLRLVKRPANPGSKSPSGVSAAPPKGRPK